MKLLFLSAVSLFALAALTGGCARRSGILPAEAGPNPPNAPVTADAVVAFAQPGTTLAALRGVFGPPHSRSHARGDTYYPPRAWEEKQGANGLSGRRPDLDRLMYWNPREGDRVASVLLDNADQTVLEARTTTCSLWLLDPSRPKRLIGKTAAEVRRIVGESGEFPLCQPEKSNDTCVALLLPGRVHLQIEYGPDHRVRTASAGGIEPV